MLKLLHQAIKPALERAGFSFEERRCGDLSIGLWRLKLSPVQKKSKKRMVLIPGLGDTPLSWLAVFGILNPVLKKRFDEVVLLDLPGFSGLMADQKCFATMDQYFSQLGDVLDSLKPELLMGHSLGGWTAAHYCSEWGSGQRTGARSKSESSSYKGPNELILISPSGLSSNRFEKAKWEAMFRRALTEGFEVLRENIFAKEPFWFKWCTGQVTAFYKKEDLIQFLGSVEESHGLQTKTQHIRAKIALIWGEKDTLVPANWIHAWVKAFEEAGTVQAAVMLKDIGHTPQIEAPARLSYVLSQVIQNKPLKSTSRVSDWLTTRYLNLIPT